MTLGGEGVETFAFLDYSRTCIVKEFDAHVLSLRSHQFALVYDIDLVGALSASRLDQIVEVGLWILQCQPLFVKSFHYW